MSDDYGYTDTSRGALDFEIDPDATEDFGFNFAPGLDGDTISSVSFLLPDGLTEVSSSNTATTATVFVSGAERGRIYRITCRYVTAGGRTRDKTIRVIGREQ